MRRIAGSGTLPGMNATPERSSSGEAGHEADLIRSAQRGDQAAFAELVRRYQRTVYRCAYALTRSTADADDLSQETFVRAYRALDRFRVGEPMQPWLLRIATNLAFSLFRSRKRRPETPIEPLIEAGMQWGVEDDPAEHLAHAEQKQRVNAAFETLKPEHQAVLTLRVVQDLSYEEIAQSLNIPVGTVMSRLSRARAELKSRLVERTGST
ncbi:MAG: sigma-70 family RNA polymerase sigma factor [Candidatus Eisenbacteria bacterium]|uniref:Sigma-70 family RNA polymerase sigma factor n=1 Tax=Eiseniibacteriota bacterium TaxID=2212470 RepID=A0A849SIU3_UNCEI|nr:sigma-70 family RNA polymerase sigma factor [Candidatus Eisenbacteria bacterium]